VNKGARFRIKEGPSGRWVQCTDKKDQGEVVLKAKAEAGKNLERGKASWEGTTLPKSKALRVKKLKPQARRRGPGGGS